MKKLLPLLILYSSISYAQIDFTRVYHPIINEAELAIVDTSYHEALSFYNEAFANVEKPFAKDYYNAAICATLIGKMPVVFDFLEKIVAKGYKIENFRKDPFFKNVADTCKQWKDFEKHAQLIKPQVNSILRDSVQRIYRAIAIPPASPLTAGLRSYIKEHSKKEKWMPVDSLLVIGNMPADLLSQMDSLRKLNSAKGSVIARESLLTIYKILEVHGYPDENVLGLNQLIQANNEGFFRSSASQSYLYESTIVSNILSMTSFQQQIEKIDIVPIIKQAIREGKVHPAVIKSLIGYSTDEPCTMGRVLVVQLRLEDNINCPDNNWQQKTERFYWKKEKSASLSEIEINERRQNLGLERLEDAYRKAFFKARPTHFLIYGGSYQSELAYIPSCEMIDKIIKGAVVLR